MASSRPTHRVHWKASCNVQIVGRGYDYYRLRTHEAKVKQAEFCWSGGLIPSKCHFGPRRLRLEGQVDYYPPRYGIGRPSKLGVDNADLIVRWTQRMLYGMQPGVEQSNMIEADNLSIEVKVRPITQE